MKLLSCTNCGSRDLTEDSGYATCDYCESTFVIEKGDTPNLETKISLRGDIADLLERIEFEPERAQFFANLILDLDPHNSTALQILQRKL